MSIPKRISQDLRSNPGIATDDRHGVFLLSPTKLGPVELKNRVVLSPMCQYSSENGYANDYHLAHYGMYALNGVGLSILEATAIAPNGRISDNDLGIWSDDHIEPLRRIVNFFHAHRSKVGIQIGHAGRKAGTNPPWDGRGPDKGLNWDIVGPSDLPFDEEHNKPRPLTKDEIQTIVKQFAEGTRRAVLAGFDVIEIHGAHGYLISSFLSPTSNIREDEYGGSFDNRIRILVDIVKAVQSELTQDKALSVRISCEEHVEGGWSPEDSVNLSKVLKELGVHVIDCSSGGNNSKQIFKSLDQGYQVEYSEKILKEAHIDTIAVGRIEDPEYAESVLKEGKASLIAVGRELLYTPSWVFKAGEKLGVDMVHSLPNSWPRSMFKK